MIDGNASDRVFQVLALASLDMRLLTVRNGATFDNGGGTLAAMSGRRMICISRYTLLRGQPARRICSGGILSRASWPS